MDVGGKGDDDDGALTENGKRRKLRVGTEEGEEIEEVKMITD